MVFGRGKSKKGTEGESSRASKKLKKPMIEESELEESESNYSLMDEDSEEEAPETAIESVGGDPNEEMGDDGLPKWGRTRALSSFRQEYRELLFHKKISQSSQSKGKLLICERKVVEEDFRRFGVFKLFEALGWKGCLDYNYDTDRVFVDEIFEWMGSLEKRNGDRPPMTTQLIGKVNGVEVTLSIPIIKKLIKIDTKRTPYEYPSHALLSVKKASGESWEQMIHEIFVVPPGTKISSWQLRKDALKAMPRLLLGIIMNNVLPRTSDRHKVRYSEVMILYSLMTGFPQLSLGHLVLYSIWETYEKSERKQIPFARLISKMLAQSKAIPSGMTGSKAPHLLFSIKNVTKASAWKYEKTMKEHVLKLKDLNRSIQCDLSDPEEEEEEETHPPSPPQTHGPYLSGFTEGMHNTPYYQHIHQTVDMARPGTFSTWPESAQYMFDRQTQDMEQRRIHERAVLYQMENFRNQDFAYHEQIRHENDYQRGWEYTVRTEPHDWTRPELESFEVTNQMPRYPQSTPSEWINPYSQPQQQQGSSSSTDPFGTRELMDSLYEGVFGARYQPPPYDG